MGASIAAAFIGLGMRLVSGWTVAWTSAAGTFAVVCVAFAIRALPPDSRRRRWSASALFGTLGAIAFALALGIPDKSYRTLGAVLVIAGMQILWSSNQERLRPEIDFFNRQWERVKRVLYFLFGEPDPDPQLPESSPDTTGRGGA